MIIFAVGTIDRSVSTQSQLSASETRLERYGTVAWVSAPDSIMEYGDTVRIRRSIVSNEGQTETNHLAASATLLKVSVVDSLWKSTI